MICLNCSKCCQATFIRDDDDVMCLSAVYCTMNGTIYDYFDTCDEFDEVM